MSLLNTHLATARTSERLAYRDGRFTMAVADSPDALLSAVARSAATLLLSEDLARVRQCGGERCRRLFLDTTRNRSRQWCQMRDCGNLAKVRRFRARRKEAGASGRHA